MLDKNYKPVPIGLVPKNIHEENVKINRFNAVCGTISRYYNEGLEIDLKWVEEYNELLPQIRDYEEERERIRNRNKID